MNPSLEENESNKELTLKIEDSGTPIPLPEPPEEK